MTGPNFDQIRKGFLKSVQPKKSYARTRRDEEVYEPNKVRAYETFYYVGLIPCKYDRKNEGNPAIFSQMIISCASHNGARLNYTI